MRYPSNLFIYGCLAVLTLGAYGSVCFSDFVDYDDAMYIGRNIHVKAGFTKDSVIWAFTNTLTGLWHPLTWLSHMLDITLFGLKPFGHHFTNLIFHLLNAMIMFRVMKLLTKAWVPSAIIAILFSIHPLHVESVAWVSERKNLLSMFFFLLSLWAYAYYIQRLKKCWYAALILFFILGIMSKPSLITLPFVLLLLDFWPLRRLSFESFGASKSLLLERIVEKRLLFLITFIACVEAIIAQQSQSAIVSMQSWPAEVRLYNILVCYIAYLGKALLPLNLIFIYVHPGKSLIFWEIFISGVLLGVITWWVSMTHKKCPYLLMGWLWFLGTLVPMIGIVQVGQQAMADRYAYIPLIGVFVMVVFGFYDGIFLIREKKRILFSLVGFAIIFFSLLTFHQVGHWKNSESLYLHALSVSENNPIPRINLGNIRFAQGFLEKAIFHYSKVLELYPEHAGVHFNIGNALMQLGRLNEAETQYLKAIRLKGGYEAAYNNLGNLYARKGKWNQAQIQYTAAIRFNPEYAEAYKNLADVFLKQNKESEAIIAYQEAIRLRPKFADAHFLLGLLFAQSGKTTQAIYHLNQAVAIRPGNANFHYNLGMAFANHGSHQDALRHLQAALDIDQRHRLSRDAIRKLVR